MIPLIITIALIAIAAVGVWGWMRNDRARKLAERKAREESERLAAERERADEKEAAEAKAREDARLQAEAKEQSRQEAEARENGRLADEQRVAAEKLATEVEATRRAEETALADAQARESDRLREETESKQRAAEEARQKARLAAEEEQRAKERRQAEERAKAEDEARETARQAADEEERRVSETKALAEAQARELARQEAEAQQAEALAKQRAEAEAREAARLAAEEEQRARAELEERESARLVVEAEARQCRETKAEEKSAESERAVETTLQDPESKVTELQVHQDEIEPASLEEPAAPLAEEAPLPKAREFTEPKPSPRTRTRAKREQAPDPTPRESLTSPILLQLVTKRGAVALNLVPHRRDGMPSSIEVTTANGRMPLSEWSEDAYQPISASEFTSSLTEGLVWQAREDGKRWRWELTRREIYVLAAGDEFGLHGFVTRRIDQRLWLNTRHVVLAKKGLRDQVAAALADAGCSPSDVCDATTPGVPPGWLLFRDVIPTRAVRMREERDPLNVLCPAHEIEPQFVGGIRLERNVWLAEFAPRIRFNGDLEEGFEVRIDDKGTQLAADGAFEAPGWDSEGEHRLWFGGQAVTYQLRTMQEGWSHWHAHDFGTGAGICGATTHRVDGARWRQIRIPAENLLLVGARPGEIFCCQPRHDVRSPTVLALVPFTPVWALPLDPVHADKRSARLVSLELLEPATVAGQFKRRIQIGDAMHRWVAAINDAGRKQLALSAQNDAIVALWRRYRAIAKQLWKQGRKRG